MSLGRLGKLLDAPNLMAGKPLDTEHQVPYADCQQALEKAGLTTPGRCPSKSL